MGGISASGLTNVTIDLSGTIVFSDDVDAWPKRPEGGVTDCLSFSNLTGVVFTSSSGQGVLDGQGKAWWGLPWIGYLMHLEDRPKLFSMDHGRDILVENITFRNSPYWTFWAQNNRGLLVRYSSIEARRSDAHSTAARTHSFYDLTAFNTDGFDVTGRNVHIHDCTIWNQDDAIAVKDGSQDMLFERITEGQKC